MVSNHFFSLKNFKFQIEINFLAMSIDKYTWFLEVHDFHFVKAQHFALELKLMKCFEYLNSNHLNCYVSQNLCWKDFSTLKMSNNHDQPTLVWATSFGSAPSRKKKQNKAPELFWYVQKTKLSIIPEAYEPQATRSR